MKTFTPAVSFAAACTAALLGATSIAQAQSPADTYPNKTVQVVIPFPSGGITDLVARTATAHLAEDLGQSFVVTNRPGAGGNIGTNIGAKADPDGYTLTMIASSQIFINPHVYKDIPFDIYKDFTPVFNIADAPQLVTINADIPAKTLKEFVQLAKDKPGSMSFGSAGNGSTPHLAGERFASLAGIEMLHVPYGGVAPAIVDVMAGRVQMISVGLAPVSAGIEAGKLRVLAVAAPKRLAALPDLPTTAEAGVPGYEISTWFGFFAPAGTDPKIIETLNASLQKMVEKPEVQKQFAGLGLVLNGGSPASVSETMAKERLMWDEIVKQTDLSPK